MDPSIFKGCKVQYSFDNNEKVYSVKVFLEGKPRIMTLRVGADFTELSLADLNGKLLEILREKKGKVSFEDLKKTS